MASPALSHIGAVESDLRTLSLESRKKYTEVKSAAERAILRLRPLQDTRIESDLMEALRSDLIIQPFLLACATKHPPLVLMSLNSMQRLSSFGALSPASVAMLIGTLRILSESTQSDILLRILQTLSMLANPATFEAGEDTIPQALGICFRLHVSELPIIYNTAVATLQQVISLVFERAMKAQKPKENPQEAVRIDSPLTVSQTTALRLFIDLLFLASGDPPQWLTAVHHDVPRTILFELISFITKDYASFIQEHQLFIDAIRNQLRPLVIRLLNAQSDFQLVVRLIHTVVNIILYYGKTLTIESESLMSLLIRMLEPEFHLWQRVLVLEAFKVFTEHPKLLTSFFINFDCGPRNTKIFASMAHGLGRVANQISLEDDKKATSLTLWRFHVGKSKGLDLLGENYSPEYDDLYAVTLATESLYNIVNAFNQLSKQVISPEASPEVLPSMLIASWYPILAALMMLLDHAHQDEQVQYYLLGFQSFIFTCAALDREAPLAEFVKSLCILTLPPGFRNLQDRIFDVSLSHELSQCSMSAKNLQAMKCIFNVLHACATKLNPSWAVIFATLEKLDAVLFSSKINAVGEFELLTKALGGFFDSSASFDRTTLMQILSTLGSLSLSSLANSATTENSNPDPNRMFPLVNFIKLITANTFRIGFLWEFCIDYLSAVLHSKHLAIRAYGVQSIIRLVKTSLKQLIEHQAVSGSGSQPADFGASQAMFLKSLRPALKGRYAENGTAVLLALYDILQTNGSTLGDGWPTIIVLLGDVISLDVSDHIPLAFKVVQLIVDDFLDAFPNEFYASLVHTIGMYGRQRLVANISFTSIGLLWQVSDHLIRLRANGESTPTADPGLANKVADDLQSVLFCELAGLCMDSRAELRNSAVQILHSTFAVCGAYISLESWDSCLNEILFRLYGSLFNPDKLKRDLPSEVESASQLGTEVATGLPLMMVMHHSRDTAEKQWDETRVHALQGSARVLRQFFRFHESVDGCKAWATFLTFVRNAICMESSEVAHYAIASIREILQSPSTVIVLSANRNLTDQVVILFQSVVLHAMELHSDVPFDVYTELLDCVSSLIGESSSNLFSGQDLLLFLQLADHLASLAPTQAREPVPQCRRETSLQRATLLLIDRLIVVESPAHLYAAVLLQVVKYVAGGVTVSTETQESDRITANAFAIRSMPILSALYCQRCPPEVQGRIDLIVPLLRSLHSVIVSPTTSLEMISTAITAFIEIVPCAIVVLNRIHDDGNSHQEFWQELQLTFCEFLSFMPSRSSHNGIQVSENGVVLGVDHLTQYEALQVQLVQLLCVHVIPQSGRADSQIQDDLLSVLVKSHESQTIIGLKTREAANEPPGKVRLMLAGVDSLFGLVETLPANISLKGLSVLQKFCTDRLRAFAHDDHIAGDRPLPRFRIKEVQTILTRLSSMEIEDKQGHKYIGRRALLQAVLPTLFDCVGARDSSIQVLLSKAMHAVSRTLSLS